MTPEGHAALVVELKQLKLVERPKISEEIGTAALHGDLKENAEYHAAREKQSHIEGRILDIEDSLARAEIIDTSKFSGDRVKCSWYNPRSGDAMDAGQFDNKGAQAFVAPSEGFGSDWVLVVDDASKGYQLPVRNRR